MVVTFLGRFGYHHRLRQGRKDVILGASDPIFLAAIVFLQQAVIAICFELVFGVGDG